jgi:hypothetical protein
MLQKRKEPKPKKSVGEALLRDMQGTAAGRHIMSQVVHNDPRTAGARRPDRGRRLPRLSWARMLRPGLSGKVMIGLFFATLLTFVAVAFWWGILRAR